jgi:AcrR family transcriptional regulator
VRRSRRVRLTAAERRSQIVEVAMALIAERGFWATSLREVAEACGITVPGLIHHFASKEALLAEVLRRRDEVDRAALTELFGGEGTSLAGVCRAIVARNATQPEVVRLFAVLQAESLDPDHPAHDFFVERQATTLRGLAARAPAGSDGEALAQLVMAMMDGLQLQWLRDPDEVDMVGLFADFLDRYRA